MEPESRVTLEDRRANLEHEVPEAADVLALLERAELELNSAKRIKRYNDPPSNLRRAWLVHLKLPVALAQSFSLAPQLLAIFSPFDEFQMRDVDAAERELTASRRLDRSVVLCFTRDPEAATRAAPALPDARKYLFSTFSEALTATDPQRWVRERLRDAFGPARLFAPGRFASWDFMGREGELRELGRTILAEGRPAGVFGLRRMGKTSLLRHWADSLLDVEAGALPDAIPLSLDLTAVGFSEQNAAGVFRRLLDEAQRWYKNAGAAGSKLSHRPWTTADVNATDIPGATLQQLGESAVNDLLRLGVEQGRRLVLVLDEYEQLLDDEGIADGVKILAWIRGLYQQHPRHFNFVVAGLDRDWLRKPRVHGRQNPLLGIVKDLPLAGLSRQNLGILVRRIGGRAQLDFDYQAVDKIYAESGGHPYLARVLCDLVDQRVPLKERQPARIGVARIEAALPRFEHEVNFSMEEFLNAARHLTKLSAEHLASLAAGADTTGIDPIALEDLESYGILIQDERGRWSHRIGVLARWLRANYDVPLAAAGGGQ